MSQTQGNAEWVKLKRYFLPDFLLHSTSYSKTKSSVNLFYINISEASYRNKNKTYIFLFSILKTSFHKIRISNLRNNTESYSYFTIYN